MSDFLAIPPVRSLSGTLRVPPSKSATNRALVLAALTGAPVDIVGPLASDDTAALRRCLAAMGARIDPTAEGLRVGGPLSGAPGTTIALDAADSGTAARFLTAVCAAVPGRFTLTGSPRLGERPTGELVAALTRAGARIRHSGADGFLPLTIEGGSLTSAEISVDASRSSQFLSAVLLAAVAIDGGLAVRALGPVASAPYVGTTVAVLRELGHEVEIAADGALRVRRGHDVAARYEVPGDYSSAVPVLAATAVAGGQVRLEGLRWPSEDADARALTVLEAMGLTVEGSAALLTASASGGVLRPVQTRATDFPDAVPSLAAAAALAGGTSRFSGIGHLRLKESDRLAALEELIVSAGGRARADGDTLEVSGPARPREVATRLSTHRDHRMAMAGAILSMRLPGILIEDPDCVAKSYPGFFRDLERLAVR
jgi:3-phosphoshikimate 1-carboxyvinyltransferase